MANTVPFEQLMAEIGADLSGLEKGLRDAKRKIDDFEKGTKFEGSGKGLDAIGAKLSNLGSKFQEIGGKMTLGVTLPLVALAKQVFDTGVQYEQAMNVFQVATSATAAEMSRAAQIAEQLGADMTLPATSAADAALAMVELGKGGLSAAQSMDAAKGVLQLAAAAAVSEARAAEIAANALNAFGLAAGEAGRVADLLAAAANASSAEITDVAASLQQSSASAAALKIPIEDLTTAIGLMANAGIKGSDAGTSLKTFMASLTPTTENAAQAMADLGIKAFDAKGSFVGLEEIIKQAQPALARMTDEQQALAIKIAFGSDAQRAANIILGQGAEKFRAMEEAVTKAGSAQALAEAKTRGLGGAVGGLWSQLETLGLKVFKTVAPALEDLVKKLSLAVSGFSELSPEVIKSGVAFTAVFAGSGPAALAIGQLLKLGPKGAVMAVAIAGVAALAAAYASNFSQMQSTLDAFAKGITSAFSSSAGQTTNFTTLMKQAGIVIGGALDIILTGIVQVVQAFIGAGKVISAFFRADFAGAASIAKETLESVTKAGDDMMARFETRGIEMLATAGRTGTGTAEEFAKMFKSTVAQQDPGISMVEALAKHKGPTIAAARAAGLAAGQAQRQGFFDATHQSPHFIIHITDEALIAVGKLTGKAKAAGAALGTAMREGFSGGDLGSLSGLEKQFVDFPLALQQKVAPQLKNATKQMKRDMKEFFDETLQMLQDYVSSTNKGFQLTVEIFARLAPATRRALLDQAKAFREHEQVMGVIFANIAAHPEKARAAFDPLIAKIKEASQVIKIESHSISTTLSGDFNLSAMTAKTEAATAFLVADAEKRKLIGEINAKNAKETNDAIIESFKDMISRLESSIGPGLTGIISAFTDGFNKIKERTLARITDVGEGIVQVIGNLPGKIGAKLQGITNSFLTWVDRIDGILRGLHKIFNDIPDGLGEALKAVIGIFKSTEKAVAQSVGNSQQEIQKAAKAASGSVDTMAKDSEEGSQGIQKAFGVATAAVGAFVSGLSVAAATGSKAIGSLVGGIQGALSGFAAGGPIGAIIGGVGGILGGLFGGKSAAQKEAERIQQEQQRLALEKAKQDVQKGAQEVIQAALSTFIKAREALEAISAHFRIPKTVFNAFFKDLNILLDQFVKLAGKFKDDIYGKAKLFAESMSPAVDLISKAPLALEAIGKYLGVTESAIIRFFADFSRIVDHLGVLAEATPNKLERHIKKFAARIGDAVGLVSDVGAGLKSLFEVKPLDAGAFDNFGLALEAIINKIGDIAERFDKYYIKQIGLFSERVAPGINLFAGTVQAIKDALEVPRLDPNVLEGIFTDLTAIVHRAIDFTKAIPSDILSLVSETATRVIPIINVIQSMAEAFKAVVDYKSVKGAFQDLLADFTEAVGMMRYLEDLSFQMETRAMSIEGALTRAAAAMTAGISKFGSALGLSHGVLTAGLSSFNAVANPGAGLSGLNFASQSFAPGIGPSLPSGPSIINNDNRTVVSIEGIDLNDEQSANLRRVLEQIFGPLERLAVST